MGSTVNIPEGHSEVARFRRLADTPPPEGQWQATKISFFRGYEAGLVTHYIGAVYTDAAGALDLWARAYNGRNTEDWTAERADLRADAEWEEVGLPDLATKREWLRT